MKNNRRSNASNELRVELKYCERCGSLWLRECGGGQIYCENCIPKVDELPAPRQTRTAPRLPVSNRAFLDDDEFELSDWDELNLESAGGAA